MLCNLNKYLEKYCRKKNDDHISGVLVVKSSANNGLIFMYLFVYAVNITV